MTTAPLPGLLRRHWLIFAVFAALGAVAGIAAARYVVTPTYAATVKLYVAGTGSTPSDRLQNGEYARTHISSYADLINSSDLLLEVRQRLDETGTGPLADSITASNPLNTLVIDVTVEDTSPDRARQVADEIGNVYNDLVGRIESPPDGASSPVRIDVVGPPERPSAPVSPDEKLYGAGGLVAGLVLGAAVAALLDAWKARRARRAPVEAARQAERNAARATRHAGKPKHSQDPVDEAPDDVAELMGEESSGGADGNRLDGEQAQERDAARR